MSWIDRINAAIVRRIHGKVPLVADEHGLEQAGQRVAYADLQHAVAYRHPDLVGDNLAIVLDFGEGRILTIAENHEAWTTVLAALDRDPHCKRPSAEWRFELRTGAEDVRIDLLD